MKPINPNPGDDYRDLSVDELVGEVVRGLDRVAEGRAMVEEGETHAGVAMYRLAQLLPGGKAALVAE